MKIRIKRLNTDYDLPLTEQRAAGFDIFCVESVVIPPHSVRAVATGIAIETPRDHVLLLASRSSTPLKKGLMLANGVGIVDPFYSGDRDEIKVLLLNFTNEEVTVDAGECLTQGIFLPKVSVEWDEITSFGHGGHGGYWI